jgi:hypothetical protein
VNEAPVEYEVVRTRHGWRVDGYRGASARRVVGAWAPWKVAALWLAVRRAARL